MLFDDWISVPPFNDVQALRQSESKVSLVFSTIFNSLCVAIPLYLSIQNIWHSSSESLFTIVCFYGGLSLGVLLSWWVPYIFGSPAAHKKQFEKFKNTHYFLPPRADNVRPNSLHVILHVLVWICFALALNWYITSV